MALDLSSVGTCLPPQQVTWTKDTTMLYALAIGAGGTDPLEELNYTTENTEGLHLKALPSLPCALASRLRYPSYGHVARHNLLHVGQNMIFHTTFPSSGTVDVVTSVIDIKPSNKGAIITLGAEFIASNGLPLIDVESVLLIRGESVPQSVALAPPFEWIRPASEPGKVITERTRPSQALLYRLLGDKNRLHSDPAFAVKAGQSSPILHGLCTLGYAVRALLNATGNTTESWNKLSVRFSAPVTPGDEITTSIWPQNNWIHFEARSHGRIVLQNGILSYK